VVVEGETENVKKDFFGVLKEVIVLEYDALKNRTSPKIVLFKCRWFDVYNEGRGIKRDKFGGTLINVARTLQTNEPFALGSQVRQVFYVGAHNECQWRWVIKMNPRNYFDFPNVEDIDDCDGSMWDNLEVETTNPIQIQEGADEEISVVRDDVAPDLVDARSVYENVVDANFIQDESDENDEDILSADEEDEFSDRESDIDSFHKDLEEDELDDDSSSV